MVLIINTAINDFLEIILARSQEIFRIREKPAKRQESEKLLKEIERILRQEKINLKLVKGVGVVMGPGSFSALRIGVVTANTLAYALGVPVVGIKLDEFKNHGDLVSKIYSGLKKAKQGGQVSPIYDKEPNITNYK